MKPSGGFHDLLFEMSNENRYGVLLILKKEAKRITDLTREMILTTTEVRRHVSRLADVGLIQRDVGGFYHLTPYGETSLLLFQEFSFLLSKREYFMTHTLTKIPIGFVKQISELGASLNLNDAMDFFRHTENLFKDSKEYVWLLVDQFPMNSLSSIVEAIERGVQIRIIEPRERILNPDLESLTSEETQALNHTRQTPLVDQRMVDEVNAYLFLSDNRCVVAFPTSEGRCDYTGFTATDSSSLKWCGGLFQHYWNEAEHRTHTHALNVRLGPISERESPGQVIVVGREDPAIDVQAVQDAVDNYDEVILEGAFNLGTSTVHIRKSVVVRGEGRENNVPSTKVYKRGWTFPFYGDTSLFEVNGEGIDVTIENIHFTDFNYTCIWSSPLCDSVKIRDNRISLRTGLGRGMMYGNRGDHVIGIASGGATDERRSPIGEVLIEGNYLDFALSYARGGYLTRGGLETDPNYRPNLENRDSYCGIGIMLNNIIGKVTVRDNVIRNMNSRGILVFDNYESADIQIVGNTIVSEVYGSYPYSSHIAGVGIHAQSAMGGSTYGSRVEISDNEIKLDKLNHCGIAVYGQSIYREGAGKLGECLVRGNKLHLEDGHVGVLIRKNDETEVYGNRISGRAYYGVHLWGSEDREGFDLGSKANLIEDNDLSDLEIKPPDEYSDSHVDGRMFTGSEGNSVTAHVWLNRYSARNVVRVKTDETVIDDGEENEVSYQDST